MKENSINKRPNYKPLFTVIFIIICLTISISRKENFDNIMENFMGVFFIIFSMFKLLNIEAFRKGFRKYDIITKKYPIYGFIYPFIELALGLLYLSNYMRFITNLSTFIIMSISSYSVIKSVRSGLDLECACLGTSLNVPLSTISIIENLFMAIMALIMLF